MANARIGNPVGSKLPRNSNLSHPELGHLILGPFSTGTAATLFPGALVNVTNAGVLELHTTKVRPAGFIEYRPTYNWGTTTPSLSASTTLPDYIDVYICAWGCGFLPADQSKVINAATLSAVVFESDEPGYCACATVAASTTIGEAAHIPIGTLLDLTAKNDGSDGDLIEVFFGNGTNSVVSSA